MAVDRIFFRGSPDDAKRIVARYIAALTGSKNEHSQAADAAHTVVGFAALSDIKDDYIRKAKGQVGEDGVSWPPLSPKTLAYGRRAPKGRGYAPGGKDGLLTRQQLQRWRQVYGHTLARLAANADEVTGDMKARAAQIAWTVVKREGGKTKLAEYANRPHEILRDTGVLLNSISPGQLGGDGINLVYQPPGGPGGDQQMFSLRSDGIIIGTNVPYAKAHQEGDPKRGIPARPFLPRIVPYEWTSRWLRAGIGAVQTGLKMALEAAA